MATVIDEPPMTVETPTLQDVVNRLGGIPSPGFWPSPHRERPPRPICSQVNATKRHLCELADGVLVEKAMGLRESLLALAIAGLLRGLR